jgi:hypothetical protein
VRSTSGIIQSGSRPEVMLTVTQNESEVVLELSATGRRVHHYSVGRTSSEVVVGQRTTASAKWEGDRLVVTGERERPDGLMIPFRLVINHEIEGRSSSSRRAARRARFGTPCAAIGPSSAALQDL